ncbi:MAG: hypothetical protein RSC93_01715 [Erysipelotrichaceae bacterium]
MSMKDICGCVLFTPQQLFKEYLIDYERIMLSCIITDTNYESLLKNSTVPIDKKLLIENDIKIIPVPVGLHFYNFSKYMITVKTYDINTVKIEDFAYVYSVTNDFIRGVTKSEIFDIEQGITPQ